MSNILDARTSEADQYILERQIEFPPEYHQAGVSILSFFGEILRRKYPEQKANVKIEQDGLNVRMIVEPLTGEREVVERALNEYGLVVTGQLAPDEYTDDKFLAITLKHELRMATARVESQKELLQMQEYSLRYHQVQIDQLRQLVGKALQSRTSPPIDVNVAPTINIQVSPGICTSIDSSFSVPQVVRYIVDDLKQLGNMLDSASDEAKLVEQTRQAIEKCDEHQPASAFGKLRELIQKISEAGGKLGKPIGRLNTGIETAQRLARHYNQVASWCSLPQVPEPFLGKRKTE